MLRHLLRLRRLTAVPLAFWLWRNRRPVGALVRFAVAVPDRYRAGERSTLLREAQRHAATLVRS